MDHAGESDYPSEDIENIVRNAIVSCLSEHSFNLKKLDDWSNAICTTCLKGLQQLHKPFKYAITCIIMQRTGSAMSTGVSMYWDASKDGYCKVPWQNATMHCIVTVYGLSVNIDDVQEADM